MRYSVLALAPFMAAAYAQSSAETTPTSTYTYSNTMTNFLTLTNSLGVVTGQPTLENGGVAVTSQPAVITSQPNLPPLATIPAGLPSGLNTVPIGGGNQSLSSFTVSVGSSTTVVLGPVATTGSSGSGDGTTGTGSNGPTGTSGDDSPSATNSDSATETTESAAGSIKAVSGAVLGLGAFVAALL